MTTILTYGTFDLLHAGHIRLLRRLEKLGDQLIVGLSTDDFNRREKGKESIFSYDERHEIVSALAMVDVVIPEKIWAQKTQDIADHDVDIFAIGDDWAGKFDYLEDRVQVVYTPRTPDISSTSVRTAMESLGREKQRALVNALEHTLTLARQM